MSVSENNSSRPVFPQSIKVLADPTQPLTEDDLCTLSNLSGPDLAQFRAEWPQIPGERRKAIMAALKEIAMDRLEMMFSEAGQTGLDDEEAEVRADALRLLDEEQDPTLINRLLGMVKDDPAATVRAATVVCLGRFVYLGELDELPVQQTERVEEALLATYADDGDAATQRRALEALGFSRRPEVNALIETAFAAEEVAWQASALLAMGRSANAERWREHVLEALDTEVDIVRIEAIRAAGELQLEEATDILVESIYDVARPIQMMTVWALGEIGGQQARVSLSELQAIAEQEEDDELLLLIEEALDNVELLEGNLDLSIFDADSFLNLLEQENSDHDEDHLN